MKSSTCASIIPLRASECMQMCISNHFFPTTRKYVIEFTKHNIETLMQVGEHNYSQDST